MSKELTTEEYYNKLWLENKDLIQENIERLDKKRFALQLMLADKDKEIKRLKSIIKEVREYIEEQKYPFCDGYDLREEDAIKILSILDKEKV